MFIDVYKCVYVHTRAYMRIEKCIHKRRHMHACMFVYTYLYACMYMYVYIHIRLYVIFLEHVLSI